MPLRIVPVECFDEEQSGMFLFYFLQGSEG